MPILIGLASLSLMALSPALAASQKPVAKSQARYSQSEVPSGLSPQVSEEEFAILRKEHSRDLDVAFFKKALAGKDAKATIRALLAIGRIGNPAGLPLIEPYLQNSNYKISRAAAAAAGWIGDSAAFGPLKQAYDSTKVIAVRNAAAKALATINHDDSLSTLQGYYAKANHSMLRAGVAEALGHSFYRHKALASAKIAKGTWHKLLSTLHSDNPETARGSAYALYMAARKKAQLPKWVIEEVESDLAATINGAKAEAKTKAKASGKTTLDPAASAYLIKLTSLYGDRRKGFLYPLLQLPVNQGVQVEAAKALFAAPKGGVQSGKIATFLADKAMKPAVKAAMIDGIAKRGKASPVVSAALKAIAEGPAQANAPWVKERAINALVKLAPKNRRVKVAEAFLAGAHRSAALKALAHAPAARALPVLLTASQSANLADAKTALEVISGYKRKDVAAKQDGAIARSCEANLLHRDFVATNHCAAIIKNLRFAHLTPKLQEAYQAITKPQEFEAKVAILSALGSFTGKVDEAFIAAAAKDDNKAVRKEALAIAKKQGMKAITMAEQGSDRQGTLVTPLTMTRKDVNDALSRVMSFETAKGRFVIKPQREAPLTAAYISSLAAANFYKGLTFHRIVANFVAQGGDPRGDGWGGSDRINPDEFQMHSHRRGTVGIATAGKDTGSCQFFVNLAPNTWLDGRYTVFADVIGGMDVIDRLAPGDAILSSKVTAALGH